MADGATICEQCGAKLAPNTQFCGSCGALVEDAPVPTAGKGTMVGLSDQPAPITAPMPPSAAAAPPSKSGGVPKKTLMGTADMLGAFAPPPKPQAESPKPPSEPAPQPSNPAPASADSANTPSDPLKSTFTGLSGEMPPVIPPESPLPARPEDGTRSTNAGMAKPARGKMGRTMLGMPAAAGPAGPRGGTLPPTGKLAEKKPAKTMFGMSGRAVTPPAPEPQERVSKATIVSTSDAPPPGPGATVPMSGDRSMHARTAFGLPNMAASAEPPTAPMAPKSQAWSETITHGELLGTPLPPRFEDEDQTDRMPSSMVKAGRSDPSVTSRPPPPKSMVGPVLLALAIVAVLGLGAYLWLGGKGAPPVKVRIENENGVERMIFEVAGAAPGAKLRFGGIEQPLSGGQAVFPLGAGSLQIGKNAVLFDVLQASGEAEPGKLVLSLDYRVTVDTAPLNAGKGAVDVVVAALPGSRVWIGGEELKLDAEGRAQRREPIEASVLATGKAVEHLVSYRVQPPSQEPQVGQIKTVVPIAALQIDRPGLEIVTAADAIEVAGTVEPDATVTLDGEPIAVQDGRFLHRLALAKPGKYAPELVARATGKAPRAIKLSIERVADLAASARAFGADASLSYAKIAQNPDIYSGQKAAFEGRIYNVSVEGGRSVLQVLVRDCPAGVRCPLWVEYGAATELTVESWVRAVGTLSGAQKFRAENDTEQTVPRLSAVVLVPIEP
jgi:hypothetical protein